MINYLKRHHLLLTVVIAALVSVIAIAVMPNINTAGVASLSAAGLLISLMRFAVAVAAAFVVLRVLDAVVDYDWSEISETIKSDPFAAGIYYGLRFIAVAWIASACFS